jgi:hypothetical protein
MSTLSFVLVCLLSGLCRDRKRPNLRGLGGRGVGLCSDVSGERARELLVDLAAPA